MGGAATAVSEIDAFQRLAGLLAVPLFGVGFVVCMRQLRQGGPALWLDAVGIHDGAMSITWDDVVSAEVRSHEVDQWPKVAVEYVVLQLKPGIEMPRSRTA
ncbi:MAG: hypothetical protein Q8K58_08760, partial [Acidimicrobiales bacterium]|nr:hypothetical protein [Acidimicrobiales bacterium]